VIQRPDEYHREFEGKDKSQYKHQKDVMNSEMTQTGEEQYKDKRSQNGMPAGDSENQGMPIMGPRIVKELVLEEFANG